MYIITNTVQGGEYTPSKVNTQEEAKAWLKECTANNICAWKMSEFEELNEMSDDEVIQWANENIEDFLFTSNRSEIWYNDESYNIMNIYDLEKL